MGGGKMRTATINRTTAETDISLTLNLDGQGQSQVDSGCGFLDNMLTLSASARPSSRRWGTRRGSSATAI